MDLALAQKLEVQLIAHSDHSLLRACCVMGGAALYTSPSPAHPDYEVVQTWDEPPKIMGTHAPNVKRFVFAIKSASRCCRRQCASCVCARRPRGATGGRGARPCVVRARPIGACVIRLIIHVFLRVVSVCVFVFDIVVDAVATAVAGRTAWCRCAWTCWFASAPPRTWRGCTSSAVTPAVRVRVRVRARPPSPLTIPMHNLRR